MHNVTLLLDGIKVKAPAGSTLLEAALANQIYIPNLCHHPELKPAGRCRLCVVEVEGRGIVASCVTAAAEGMVVRTASPKITQIRKIMLNLLLTNHHKDCLNCYQNSSCELQKISAYLGIPEKNRSVHSGLSELETKADERCAVLPIDSSNPFFEFDPAKCVLCGICVRTCDELQNVHAIDYVHRSNQTVVSTFGQSPLKNSCCESCGECVVRCPTGALSIKNRVKPFREVKTICTYCGCGCSLFLGMQGDQVVSARGDPESPVNRGRLCVKGRFGFEFINHPDRLKKPLIRRNGILEETSWEEAFTCISRKLPAYQKDNFAFLASARCTNEDNYVMQKFTRAVMKTNHIDHCARLCHAPTLSGLAQTFGSGAMTNAIAEIEEAQCILAIGTNTTEAHPIIALRLKTATRKGAVLIVANPKEIDLCRHATLFLQHKPGTDVALLMGIMKVIVDRQWANESFIQHRCENYEPFVQSLSAFDLKWVTSKTGVSQEKIIQAAHYFSSLSPASILYAMGITQHTHGTDNVLAASNLALLTGNVGKRASGVNPLRGQNNVQGACDMGALPTFYPGYQKVNDPAVCAYFEKAWSTSLSSKAGLTHLEMFHAVDAGNIKAMYIAGENPVLSEANANHVISSLNNLDFLIVQDIFLTETAQLADVVLPAASFAEKDGTFTNTERRIQRIRKAITPIGESKEDWKIISEIAQHMDAPGFAYQNTEEIFDEIAHVTPSYRGLSFQRLEHQGIQWPCPDKKHPGTPFLHSERFATPHGKAKFIPLSYRPSAEYPDQNYPLLLTTDRSLFHYHTGTMTRKVMGLNDLHGCEALEINPIDAELYRVSEGEKVLAISRRGQIAVHVKITDTIPPGIACMTFHFHESPTNQLTNAACDPIAKIPETKVCSIKIEKIPTTL